MFGCYYEFLTHVEHHSGCAWSVSTDALSDVVPNGEIYLWVLACGLHKDFGANGNHSYSQRTWYGVISEVRVICISK